MDGVAVNFERKVAAMVDGLSDVYFSWRMDFFGQCCVQFQIDFSRRAAST